MEREILFRGKHDPKYGTGWCYGVPYTDHDGDCIMATHISRRVVIEETVGQFTGLYDSTKWESLLESDKKEWLKNHVADEWKGRRIFEGDILDLTPYMITDVGVVKFGEFKDLDMGNDYPCGHVGFYVDVVNQRIYARKDILFFASECKVVGNIHDNPELMGGGVNDGTNNKA